MQNERTDTAIATQPAQILVAYDFSECSELALQHALNLALEPIAREFHFLVALDPHKGLGLRKNEVVGYEYAAEIQELATKRIEDAMSTRGGEVSVMVHVRIGEPVHHILGLAEEIGASLILVGSHGRTGVKRVLLGSVSEHVVREAGCPVFVARERSYSEVRRPQIVEVKKEEGGPAYVPPHRFHYNTGVPTRDKAWTLY